MSPRGITSSGNVAEKLFCELTGAARTKRLSALGDACLDGQYVEIKQTRAKENSRNLNQVRANKYLPLVVYEVPERQWYVIPADDVVREILRTKRALGQHNGSPYMCSFIPLKRFKEYKVDKNDLAREVKAAARKADKQVGLKNYLNRILDDQLERNLSQHYEVERLLQ